MTMTDSTTNKTITSYSKTSESHHQSFGKYWAAVSGTKVITLTLIPTISDPVIFNTFRDKAREAISLAGELATGEVQMRDGKKVFVKRLNRHQNVKGTSADREEKIYILPSFTQ